MATRNIHGNWYVDIRHQHRRYRKKSPINTRGDAKAYERLLMGKLLAGESLDPPAPPPAEVRYSEFAWRWYQTYVRTNNKPSEQRNKELHLRLHLLPVFGKLPLQGITSQLVESFKAQQLSQGLSAKTVNNHLATLRKSLNCAVDWDMLERLPKIRLLKAPRRLPETLSDDECARLLSDRSEPMWHAMVLLALRTGMRLGELMGLTWGDLDFDARLLTVRQSIVRGFVSTPKSGRPRVIPLDEEVVTTLRALQRTSTSDLVFPRGNGEALSDHMCEYGLTRLARRVRVRHIGWHVLRHTFATQLLQEREPIRNIQQLLGHSTLAMTERYTHVLMPHLRESIDVLAARQRRLVHSFGHYMGTEPAEPITLPLPSSSLAPISIAQQSKEHRFRGAPS